MLRFIVSLLTLAAGIGIFLLAGTVLLPVVGLVVLIVLAAAVFFPRRVSVPPEPAMDEMPEEDDIPASQAVIDISAKPVTNEQEEQER